MESRLPPVRHCRPDRAERKGRWRGGHLLVCDHVQPQPGRVGAKLTARHVVECQPGLEVADHILDQGVVAMVGLQLQRVAIPIGDERVVAVGQALEPELGGRV
jgi:hypothetical protein